MIHKSVIHIIVGSLINQYRVKYNIVENFQIFNVLLIEEASVIQRLEVREVRSTNELLWDPSIMNLWGPQKLSII